MDEVSVPMNEVSVPMERSFGTHGRSFGIHGRSFGAHERGFGTHGRTMSMPLQRRRNSLNTKINRRACVHLFNLFIYSEYL